MTPDELRQRLADFAREVMFFTRPLLDKSDARQVALQLRSAANSAAANHRSAGRARSHPEFISKLGIAVEEIDEALFWLEHIRTCSLAGSKDTMNLIGECRQLVAILTTSRATAQSKDRLQTTSKLRR